MLSFEGTHLTAKPERGVATDSHSQVKRQWASGDLEAPFETAARAAWLSIQPRTELPRVTSAKTLRLMTKARIS